MEQQHALPSRPVLQSQPAGGAQLFGLGDTGLDVVAAKDEIFLGQRFPVRFSGAPAVGGEAHPVVKHRPPNGFGPATHSDFFPVQRVQTDMDPAFFVCLQVGGK